MENSKAALISHKDHGFDLKEARVRVGSQGNIGMLVEEQLALLDQLTKFDLGNFLLKNKGLNGEWTSYVILHGPEKEDLSPLERWFLNEAPVVLATRERYSIFQREIQARLKEGMSLASVPCGVMEDLMTLDFSKLRNISLFGLDLDSESISLAKAKETQLKNAGKLPKSMSISFDKIDAWSLGQEGVFDILVSNGLNIYGSDDGRVTDLYRKYHQALKPGGILITSFLTPPPTLNSGSPWKMDQLNPDDLLKQKVLMGDIVGAKWTCFRTEAQTRQQLEEAGFRNIQIIYDTKGLFPTIIAEKI